MDGNPGHKPPEGAASAEPSCRLNPGTTQPQILYRPYPFPSPAVRCVGQNPPKKKVMEQRTLFQLAAPRDFTTGLHPPSCHFTPGPITFLVAHPPRPRKPAGDSSGWPGSRTSGPWSVPGARGTFLLLFPQPSVCVPHPPPPLESPFVRPSSPPPKKKGTQRVARRSGHQKAWHSRSTAGISRLGCNQLVLRSVTATQAGVKLGHAGPAPLLKITLLLRHAACSKDRRDESREGKEGKVKSRREKLTRDKEIRRVQK